MVYSFWINFLDDDDDMQTLGILDMRGMNLSSDIFLLYSKEKQEKFYTHLMNLLE